MSSRERSAAHPSATWSECMTLIKELDSLGKGPVSLEVLASAFNIKNWKTKTFQAKITSARQFGLINLKSGAVSLTDESRALLYPTVPDIRPIELSLFSRPSLYEKLLGSYEGKPLPRRDLFENMLVANYGISDAAKKKAAETFISSAEELGILRNGIVAYEEAVADSNRAPSEPSAPANSQILHDEESEPIATAPVTNKNTKPLFTLSIPVSDGSRSIEIKIPEGASAADLDMAKAMLDVYGQRFEDRKDDAC